MSEVNVKHENPEEDIQVQILTQDTDQDEYFNEEESSNVVEIAGEEIIVTERVIDSCGEEIDCEYVMIAVNEKGQQILVPKEAYEEPLSPNASVGKSKSDAEETPPVSHEVQVASILLDAAGGKLTKNEGSFVNDPACSDAQEVVIESSTSEDKKDLRYQEAFLTFCEDVQKEVENQANNPNRKYQCNLCPKVYSDPSSLSKHRKIHNMGKPFECNVCGSAFNHPSNLTKHMKIHLKEKPYKCGICEKLFSDLSNLNKHEKLHTNVKPYICSICQRAFADPSNMRKHFKLHFGERPFKCEVCDKTFADSSNLKKHKVIHMEHKPHMCTICQKTFTDTSNLNKHVRLHNGEKPYKCILCDKAFADLSNLRKHERTHSDVKPYACGLCDKKYSDKSNLTKHLKSHSDPSKSFMCAICGRVFASMKGVQMHYRSHQEDEPVVAKTVVIRSGEGEENIEGEGKGNVATPVVIIQGISSAAGSQEEPEAAEVTAEVVYNEEIEGTTEIVYCEEIIGETGMSISENDNQLSLQAEGANETVETILVVNE